MIENPTLLILVVLYKRNLDQSETWKSLENAMEYLNPKSKILVFDNSPKPLSGKDQIAISIMRFKTAYFHNPENMSLAKIYNSVLSEAGCYDFLLLLDQDSSFNIDFFGTFFKANINHPKIDLFLPYVKSGRTIVSPGLWLGFKGKYWDCLKTGIVESRNLTAIASGMCIRTSYLVDTFKGFDEFFQLYGIDTFFMIEFAKQRQEVFVLNYELGHDLSDYSETNLENRLTRFRDFSRSTILLTDKNNALRVKAIFYLYYKGIKISLKYNDYRFALPFLKENNDKQSV